MALLLCALCLCYVCLEDVCLHFCAVLCGSLVVGIYCRGSWVSGSLPYCMLLLTHNFKYILGTFYFQSA